MVDQATELRKLVLRSLREPVSDGNPPPRRLVVCGAASGVGVTTLSVHLAVALSGQGARVVLVDADSHRADVANLCGLTPSVGITDVLAARRDIHEVLQPGPGGIQVVVGREEAWRPADCSEVAQQRLLRQLSRLGRHADLIVLDAGCGTYEVMRRFWQAANQVVLVATPQTLALTDICAGLRRWVCKDGPVSLRLVVNRASNQSFAEEVQHSLRDASESLRGWHFDLLGCLPNDPDIEAAGPVPARRGRVRTDTLLTRAVDALAARLLAEKPQPTAAARPQGRGMAEFLNSTDLTQPHPDFSPIEI